MTRNHENTSHPIRGFRRTNPANFFEKNLKVLKNKKLVSWFYARHMDLWSNSSWRCAWLQSIRQWPVIRAIGCIKHPSIQMMHRLRIGCCSRSVRFFQQDAGTTAWCKLKAKPVRWDDETFLHAQSFSIFQIMGIFSILNNCRVVLATAYIF